MNDNPVRDRSIRGVVLVVAAVVMSPVVAVTQQGSDPGMAVGGSPRLGPASRRLSFDERVACQRSVEEVYWRHRLWPETNPSPKPPLSRVLPDATIATKVEDALAKSGALATLWGRPITAAQLQAEIDHMARSTRDPEMLRDLWDALDNDPVLVAECLARPMLADRLIRNWYAVDARFHGEVRAQAEMDLATAGTAHAMRATTGRYEQRIWRKKDERSAGAGDPAFPDGVTLLAEEEWGAAMTWLHTVFESDGAQPAGGVPDLPVGLLSPLQEDEHGFRVVAVLEREIDQVVVGTVSWPKQPFDAWWEAQRAVLSSHLTADGDSGLSLPEISGTDCTADTWSSTPFLPRRRDLHVSVWTGVEMLVWAGDFVEPAVIPGGRYDPATDTWRPINALDAPSTRQRATAVWTGTEMIAWGGWGGGTGDNVKNTGGRYDPTSDSWTPTSTAGPVPAARWRHTAVWTGTEMIVWGGCAGMSCFQTLDTGGRYDPATDSWESVATSGAPSDRYLHTAVWTGGEMIVWGGEQPGAVFADGARYDPSADTWSPLASTGAPQARSLHSAVWTGEEMIVWGGCRSRGCFFPLLDSGARYAPATDSWAPTSIVDAPYQRRHHTAVWTGSEMIIWGGCVDSDCSDFRDSGGRYDPGTDSWSPTDRTTVPEARAMHTAVWTGNEMIIWGGCHSGECQNEMYSGGRYAPATDSWVPTSVDAAPVGRILHTAAWTGTEMIIWGGQAAFPMNHGKRYDLATDRWMPVSQLGAPAARSRHTAVWTGQEMVIWGGTVATGGRNDTGGRYDPLIDAWTPTATVDAPAGRSQHTAVWTGAEMIVWGGFTDAATDTGGRYDPVTDTWVPTTAQGAPSGRLQHSAVWTGQEMIVWGGGTDASSLTATGGRYSPASDQWTATDLSGVPAARRLHTAVWTGAEMVVWGGDGDGTGVGLGDGSRYDPQADLWTPVSGTLAPAPRHSHAAVWTGTDMIVWGGEDAGTLHLTGGRYTPQTDAWIATGTGAFVPFDRKLHTAVWTGTEMIAWGGQRGTAYTDTGGLYCASGSMSSGPPGGVQALTVTRSGGELQLAWEPTCSAETTDYAVYTGTIGDWTGYMPHLCSTGGAASMTMTIDGDGIYILVVPRNDAMEGSYGTDANGAERAPSAAACQPLQRTDGCSGTSP